MSSNETELVDYLYDLLDEDEKAAFEARLRAEPALAQELKALEETLRLTRQVEPVAPPPFLSARILAHANGAEAAPWFRRILTGRGLGVFASAIGCTLLVVVVSRTPGQAPAEIQPTAARGVAPAAAPAPAAEALEVMDALEVPRESDVVTEAKASVAEASPRPRAEAEAPQAQMPRARAPKPARRARAKRTSPEPRPRNAEVFAEDVQGDFGAEGRSLGVGGMGSATGGMGSATGRGARMVAKSVHPITGPAPPALGREGSGLYQIESRPVFAEVKALLARRDFEGAIRRTHRARERSQGTERDGLTLLLAEIERERGRKQQARKWFQQAARSQDRRIKERAVQSLAALEAADSGPDSKDEF